MYLELITPIQTKISGRLMLVKNKKVFVELKLNKTRGFNVLNLYITATNKNCVYSNNIK